MPKNSTATAALTFSFFALLLLLLLRVSLSDAARPLPNGAQEQGVVAVLRPNEMGELEGCEGVGEDECLTRRSLVAHLDYIYTQDDKH